MPSMLVTGATGVVGRDLVERARATGWDVVGCSARGAVPGGPDGPVGAVAWRMGAEPAPAELRRPWDVVVHAAARPKWNLSAEAAHAANAAPVAALAEVVGVDTHLVHVSTAYATGTRGDVSSADLADYRNTYEWSKAAAERAVRARFGEVTVVRPPLVIGRRSDGAVARFSGLYSIVRSALAGMLPVFVAEDGAMVEVVSCSDVTDCVLAAAGRSCSGGTEVLGHGGAAPAVKAVVDAMFAGLNRWRTAHGAAEFRPPQIITPDQWNRFYLPFARPHMTGRQRHFTDLLSEFQPYMSLTEPLPATWRVPPVLDCVQLSIERWAATFPRLALSTPAPWVGVDTGDDTEDHTEDHTENDDEGVA
ncbi:MAG: hypothetical protein AVDCRST_MAG41-3205 [uncultured Corynebacteriales bacterium]|uniref:Thioester reductase (TE) domain-containing protein n=1 Tax=uncultured Mycobacteriales bacterium TaxID=581187 RepID=A0A6J4JB47_9ACTN|nr:MAG: hypothetical protein AVDCRST_MAG41-3205 [uncultured Corynebacteriales bacterium]